MASEGGPLKIGFLPLATYQALVDSWISSATSSHSSLLIGRISKTDLWSVIGKSVLILELVQKGLAGKTHEHGHILVSGKDNDGR